MLYTVLVKTFPSPLTSALVHNIYWVEWEVTGQIFRFWSNQCLPRRERKTACL